MAYSNNSEAIERATSNSEFESLRYRAVEYLELYQSRQRATFERGLLGMDLAQGESLPVNEDDGLLIAQLRYNQARAIEHLSPLREDLTTSEKRLTQRRSSVFIGSLLFGALGTALFSNLFLRFYDSHTRLLRWMPSPLRDILSISPLPLGLLFDWAYAHRISAIQEADARLGALITNIKLTQPVSDDDVAWIRQLRWHGVF